MPNFYNLLRARKFSTAADTALEMAPYNSATPNFSIDAGGKISWSSGSETADTNLYRSAANTLKTDDSFDIASGQTYKVDGADVLSGTTLGSGIVNSSLTSLGTISSLQASSPNFSGTAVFTGDNFTLDVLGNVAITGTLSLKGIREEVVDATPSTNVYTCNYSSGAIFYSTSAPSADFTVNLTNVPTDNGKAITVSIVITQGSTGYIPGTVQIADVGQTIKWVGGSAPTPTSSSGKIDIFNLTLIRRSGSWTVLANANLNY